MWDTILDILREKAAAGLDVRVLYDDVGSICTLPKNYDRYLMSLGIHAVRFNRFIPTLNTYLNYRNHRKMTIIDGNVGYMGGINLADEYINKKVRFGCWKDTGIMLRGEGTANMTALFLQMWEYVTGEDMPPLENYLPTAKLPADGYVQPFGGFTARRASIPVNPPTCRSSITRESTSISPRRILYWTTR